MRIQPKNNKQKYLAIAIAVVVVAALVAAVFMYATKDDNTIKRDASGTSVERTTQDKALEEDLNKNPSRKTEAIQTDRPATPEMDSATQLQRASVVLTSASERDGMVIASGFVSNVTEEGGACVYRFRKDGAMVEKTSQTLTNSSSTTCKTVQFDKNELSAGTWVVTAEYASKTSFGKSNEMEMVVR